MLDHVPEIAMSQPLDRQSDMQPIDPHGDGPYTRGDFPHKLRGDYARFKWVVSMEVTRKLIERHPPTGEMASGANAVMARHRERETTGCRYDQRDRDHDMLRGAEVLSQLARRLMDARRVHTMPFERTEELMQDSRDSVDGLLSDLVKVIATRWAPGMVNIGCRLPLSRQADFERWMNEQVNYCLFGLDRCQTEFLACEGVEFEAKRWQSGWGVFDIALLNVVLLFKDGCKMADGIIDVNDVTSAAVKANAGRAWALLEAVQLQHIESTWQSLQDAIGALDRWLDLVHYAQLVRGVSDDLAPHLLDTMRWQK